MAGWKNVFVAGVCLCAWMSAQAQSNAATPRDNPSVGAVSAHAMHAGYGAALEAGPLEFGDGHLPSLAVNLNEHVIRIPAGPDGELSLEATVFKPDGPGPFPLVVFNHGKIEGDPRAQARSRPVAFAREFVRRGYIVVAPNREGFAGSGGKYRQEGCDVTRNGYAQADDVAATIAFMSRQPEVDAAHIVVAGASHGGLTTMAYGNEAAPGVRGLINFSGGLRQDACTGWQENLTQAFGTYGENARLPSLWIYGDNDSVWTPQLTARLYSAYVAHGARAHMVDFGDYKNDAHRLVVDRDGVHIWWPAVEAFLARIGMPTRVEYRVEGPTEPHASGYASIDAVDAVPFLDAAGRVAYQKFLHQYPSRAFAVSHSGAWSWAEGDDDPRAVALSNCRRENGGDPCKLYAVDDMVVWNDKQADTTQTAAAHDEASPAATATANVTENGALASRY